MHAPHDNGKRRLAKTLMIQGTTSDAGKSTLVAGLCRVLKRRGYAVAPFKPQNMALNSAVTCDAGEIGRAQAVQAQDAGLEPHSDMNPVLLKPASDTPAQVIVQGRVVADLDACDFHHYKPKAMRAGLITSVNAAYTPDELRELVAESQLETPDVHANAMGVSVHRQAS